MKTQKIGFVDISVFYDKADWHLLLKECLGPFIANTYKGPGRHVYFIYLNNEKGHNIRFCLPCKYEDILNVSKEIEDWINQFLNKVPSATRSSKYPLETIFMDFPSNSFKYNVIKKKIDNDAFLGVHALVSKHILTVLGKDIIDMESSFAFSLYIHFQLIKAFRSVYAADSLIRTLEYMGEKQLEQYITGGCSFSQVRKEVMESYINNKEIILEIYHDSMSDVIGDELYWLSEWREEGKGLVQQGSFEQQFLIFFKTIHEHLGLSDIQKLFTLFALGESLKEANKESTMSVS